MNPIRSILHTSERYTAVVKRFSCYSKINTWLASWGLGLDGYYWLEAALKSRVNILYLILLCIICDIC